MYGGERSEQKRTSMLSERIRLALLCLLLACTLGLLVYTCVNTFQAVQNFQYQYNEVKEGDVSTIHPWMTIHVISRIYHIPEDYLYQSLNIPSVEPLGHATLYDIASHKKLTVNQVIHTLQYAIISYRKKHPGSPTPAPTRRTGRYPRAPTPGRSQY